MAGTNFSSPGGKFSRARTNFNAKLMVGGNTSPAAHFGGSPGKQTARRARSPVSFFGTAGKNAKRRG